MTEKQNCEALKKKMPKNSKKFSIVQEKHKKGNNVHMASGENSQKVRIDYVVINKG